MFNISEDEFELKNILTENKSLASEMKTELDQIIKEISNSPHLQNPPRIVIGSKLENPVYLNRNDASGQAMNPREQETYGSWKIKILEGTYNIRFKFIKPLVTSGTMYLETNSLIYRHENKKKLTDIIEMKDLCFSEMECDLIPYYNVGGKNIFPFWVELERVQ